MNIAFELKMIRIVVGIAFLILIILALYLPGEPFNKHDWMSAHLKDPSNFVTFEFSINDRVAFNGKGFHKCFDICLAHGEIKPIACPKP